MLLVCSTRAAGRGSLADRPIRGHCPAVEEKAAHVHARKTDAEGGVRRPRRYRDGLLRGRAAHGHPRDPLSRLAGAGVFLAPSAAGVRSGRTLGDRARHARLWPDRRAGGGGGLRHRTSYRGSGRATRPSRRGEGDLLRPRLGRHRRLADAAALSRPHRGGDRRQHPFHATPSRRSNRHHAPPLWRQDVHRRLPDARRGRRRAGGRRRQDDELLHAPPYRRHPARQRRPLDSRHPRTAKPRPPPPSP